MAVVTGLTKARMLAIEASTLARMNEVDDASITGAHTEASGALNLERHLILTTRGGSSIDAGDIRGIPGPNGVESDVAIALDAMEATLQDVYQSRYTTVDVVADYGADPTGQTSTSTKAAFESAIQAANARGGNTLIQLPPGTYNLADGLTTPILKNYVWFVGAGFGVTRIQVTTGTLFTWGDGITTVIGGGAAHIDFYGIGTVSTTQRLIHINGGSSQKFRYFMLDGVRQIARLGELVGLGGAASAPSLRHMYGSTAAIAYSVAIDAVRGSSLDLEDLIISAKGVGYPTGRTELHPAPAGLTFLRLGKGSWDTGKVTNITSNRYDIGLDIDAEAGANIGAFWFYGCVFDYCKTRGIRLRVNGASAYIGQVNFNGGWAVATDQYSVQVSQATGMIENIHFTDVSAQQAGKSNWNFMAVDKLRDVRLTNCLGHSGNRLSGNVGTDTSDVAILASGVRIKGGRFGLAVSGNAFQPDTGITANSNIDVTIIGVTATGSVKGWAIDGNTVADCRSLVADNSTESSTVKPEYTTLQSGLVAAPASGATNTHKNPFRETLYIYDGTVTEVKHNGFIVATSTPMSLQIRPGDTWSVTYSDAPTVKRIVHA